MIRGRRAQIVPAIALTCAAIALTGCATGAVTDPTAAPSHTGTVPSVLPTTTPTTSAPTTSVSSVAVPTKTRSTAPTTTKTALPAGFCTSDQLTIRVLPGGAIQNYEIAAVTFTNSSAKACSLSGYPNVQLRLKGKALATATPESSHPSKLIRLSAGGQAQAQIRDHSTCQAPLSDTIHVTAPAPLDSLEYDRPFQLRGCTVVVDPVTLGS